MISPTRQPQFPSSCVRLRSALRAMDRWPALLLLAAMAFASVQTGLLVCGPFEWQCGDGKCIYAENTCDGEPHCSDGSDEEAAMCTVPSIRVQVGQVATVRAEYKHEHGDVNCILCGGTSCSGLLLGGRTADGALRYSAWTECNAHGAHCRSLHHQTSADGRQDFPAGPLVLKAERRPGELALWLDGHEDKVATVPVKDDYDLLRVRPWKWRSKLAVQFNVSSSCSKQGKGGSYVPEDGSCFEVQSGAIVYVKPKERVSEKLQCSSEAVQCELQRGSSKQYGPEWAQVHGTENSTAKTHSDSLSVSIEGGFYDLISVPESNEHAWSREMAEAMSHTVSTGWSNETVQVSMPVCLIPPGRTGWVGLKPEFYAKQAVVRYLNGTSAAIVRLFPKTTADGSIAGERRCVVEKTMAEWRRRRRNLQGVNDSENTPCTRPCNTLMIPADNTQ